MARSHTVRPEAGGVSQATGLSWGRPCDGLVCVACVHVISAELRGVSDTETRVQRGTRRSSAWLSYQTADAERRNDGSCLRDVREISTTV
jgi:hypothetical protein